MGLSVSCQGIVSCDAKRLVSPKPRRWTTSAVEQPGASRQLQCGQCFESVHPPEITIRYDCRDAVWPLRIGSSVAHWMRGRWGQWNRIVGCYLDSQSTGWIRDNPSPLTPATIVPSIAGRRGSGRVASKAIGDNRRGNVETIICSSRDSSSDRQIGGSARRNQRSLIYS